MLCLQNFSPFFGRDFVFVVSMLWFLAAVALDLLRGSLCGIGSVG